jgi:hypothetical protein
MPIRTDTGIFRGPRWLVESRGWGGCLAAARARTNGALDVAWVEATRKGHRQGASHVDVQPTSAKFGVWRTLRGSAIPEVRAVTPITSMP